MSPPDVDGASPRGLSAGGPGATIALGGGSVDDPTGSRRPDSRQSEFHPPAEALALAARGMVTFPWVGGRPDVRAGANLDGWRRNPGAPVGFLDGDGYCYELRPDGLAECRGRIDWYGWCPDSELFGLSVTFLFHERGTKA